MNLPKDKNELKNEYFSWLDKNQEDLKPIISDAIDSLYKIYQDRYDENDLEHFKNGLKLNHLNSWALAEHINEFAEKDERFKTMILELSKHNSSEVRLNMVANVLLDNRIEDLADKILTDALNDRSKRVRLKAADVMLRLNKEALCEKLLQRAEIETDEETKKTLLWTYELISKKWTFEPDRNCISVHLKDGGVSGFYLEDGNDMNDIEWIEKKVVEIRNDY